MTRYQRLLFMALLIATALSCYNAPYPRELVLHHAATIAGIVIARRLTMRFSLSDGAFTCLTLFLGFHVLGARYIYSYVPYSDWSTALLGFSIDETCGFTRNHYDRLVHLAFGFLFARPTYEVLRSTVKLEPRQIAVAVLLVIISLSFIYELIEWGVALTFAPDYAESFNGQQGDRWDAHQDMALALLGSFLAVIPLIFRKGNTDR